MIYSPWMHILNICVLSVAQNWKIHSFLSTDAAIKFAVSLILSRLGNCISLLAGIPDNKLNKLQHIQKSCSPTWPPQVQACKCNSTAQSVFSVSIRTVCHHIFLTFFIHTIPLGHCTFLTPLCWQLLASLLRPREKALSLFLDPLSETSYHYPSDKHSVSQLLKRNLRPICLKFISAEMQKCVLVSVCIIQEVVCVCVCISLSLSLYIYMSIYIYHSVRLSVNVPVCMCTCMSVCTCEENCVWVFG